MNVKKIMFYKQLIQVNNKIYSDINFDTLDEIGNNSLTFW
jgi:hypothetical protein